ncbi:hypothetical protein EYF80_048317 [Liparis tanakae]|uniref:Uncharacterized protein n=1 Tax=Liparis tanakae TaxID=230148 RepID=A0A4Z2FKI3_9TELE|nr:hypothetical protein EYF80_048317 [Liparis tanakae]
MNYESADKVGVSRVPHPRAHEVSAVKHKEDAHRRPCPSSAVERRLIFPFLYAGLLPAHLIRSPEDTL